MIYKYNKNFLTTYDRFDIVFVRGEGVIFIVICLDGILLLILLL